MCNSSGVIRDSVLGIKRAQGVFVFFFFFSLATDKTPNKDLNCLRITEADTTKAYMYS